MSNNSNKLSKSSLDIDLDVEIEKICSRIREVLSKTLRKRGLDKTTLVLFTSDGGHFWGEHGLIDKRCAYEEWQLSTARYVNWGVKTIVFCFPKMVRRGVPVD